MSRVRERMGSGEQLTMVTGVTAKKVNGCVAEVWKEWENQESAKDMKRRHDGAESRKSSSKATWSSGGELCSFADYQIMTLKVAAMLLPPLPPPGEDVKQAAPGEARRRRGEEEELRQYLERGEAIKEKKRQSRLEKEKEEKRKRRVPE